MGVSCLPCTHLSRNTLPIQAAFELPAPLPSWPSVAGYGTLELGGLEICQVSTFAKAWTALEGGAGGLGATFFNPSPLPAGFSSLGSYAQPNNRPLFGRVLVARNSTTADGSTAAALRSPVDYKLLWTSANSKLHRDGDGYFWLPTPPDGYRAVGLLVTSSPQKPPLDAVRCVRENLTDQAAENDESVWSDGDGFEVHTRRPSLQNSGVPVGTFAAGAASSAVACLKNLAAGSQVASTVAINGAPLIETLVQAYSPWFWFHPDDPYLPSSVDWFFGNGALLYKKSDPANPVAIDPANPVAIDPAAYPRPGLVLQGDAKLGVGVRNDAKGGGPGMDGGGRYKLLAVDGEAEAVEPPWLNYLREWGPKVESDVGKTIERATRLLPGRLRRALEKVVSELPAELIGEEGPTGPKEKGSWSGDEKANN